ncbi:TetR/AcrR family transcriptional regulator [Schumannella soli]|uniref:TetR/AcrR family transcriptional regulator n=1 Tax=Schumannella soli TaxID=2590779 RepID=A0A506YAB5_9MICO|nr:TetR/AcrR family transcriptional regulator [Schumannella soli]TPW78088.1 TetR/AcrR family transcriptional regulator [Schumannella soli]
MGSRASTIDRILNAAEEHFFRDGIASTPIDAITAAADVSSATLYRAFPSKNDLVSAALRRRHAAWLTVWDEAIDRYTAPRDRLLAVFEAIDDFADRPMGARWCAFLGTAAEFTDAPPVILEAVNLDTDTLRTRLEQLARKLPAADPTGLAEQLLLIITGHLGMRLRNSNYPSATALTIGQHLVAESRRPHRPSNN